MTGKTTLDADLIRELAKLLDETGLSEIEYDTGGQRLRVARNLVAAHAVAAPVAGVSAASAGVAPTEAGHHPGAVTAPMVGVAYLAPEPGAPNFVKPGDQVAEGQTVLLIEAMKTFNPIRAPKAGKVTLILVNNGQPVEFGEPLIVLE
ncbi:MAG: acetyl-CoA carboxylase biotin carboxyl carrier protein [Rhodospirillales bacterium]|nr:acetyl-CoA carboxylase biotin carboxyl carrier protein [Rhodospirillales bacterium]